jgi:hypothetical protein
MTTGNPYNDDDRAPVWAQGYQLGYDEPETDHAPPVPPDLVGVFSEGEQAGRDDRRSEIPVGPPAPQDAPDEPPDQHLGEAAGEVVLEVAKHVLADVAFGSVGGLISLVTLVVSIPGDVQLRPLDPEWTGKADGWGATFVAVCPEIHMQPSDGVTPDGYWAGPVQQSFGDADNDRTAHGHEQAFVALCSLDTGVCGPVVPVNP